MTKQGGGTRLLVIEPGAPQPAAWVLPDHAPSFHTEIEAGLADMFAQGCDCVVLSVRGWMPQARAIAQLRQSCDDREVPLVLAGVGTEPGLAAALSTESFDGVVDLAWPPDLQVAALESAMRRFQLGPNVVGLQRVVLEAARDEVRSLEELAFRDDLTRLHNLRYFREVLEKEHARCERHGRPYGLIYLDLDHLKGINTRHGHNVGSKVLERLGGILQESIRACDYAFRVGGDEFTLLITEGTAEEALVFAERTMERIRAADVRVGQVHVGMTVSVGVASFPADGARSAEILERSDRALFQAKSEGRDRVVRYGAPPRS